MSKHIRLNRFETIIPLEKLPEMPETQKLEPGVSPWSHSATPKYPPPPPPPKKIQKFSPNPVKKINLVNFDFYGKNNKFRWLYIITDNLISLLRIFFVFYGDQFFFAKAVFFQEFLD